MITRRVPARRGNKKQCGICLKFKPLKAFDGKRGQCRECRCLVAVAYRKRRKQDGGRKRLTNPYSAQSVLLMSDLIECACCGEQVERRKMWKHLKVHNR